MITIQELTSEADLAKGFRNLLLTSETLDAKTLVSVTVHRSDNLALYDETPSYMPLPFSVEANPTLAAMLLKLAGSMLERRHLSQIPSETLLSADDPVPYEIPNCREG